MDKREQLISKLTQKEMLEIIGEYNSLEELADMIIDSLDDKEIEEFMTKHAFGGN